MFTVDSEHWYFIRANFWPKINHNNFLRNKITKRIAVVLIFIFLHMNFKQLYTSLVLVQNL